MTFLPPLSGATSQQLALAIHKLAGRLGVGEGMGAEVSASEWGVLADGSDQTARLQSAIDALPGGRGVVILPSGTITCASSIDLSAKQSVTLRGQGNYANTVLSFTGTGAGDFINARGSLRVALKDLAVTYTNIGFTGQLVSFGGVSGYGHLLDVNLSCTATQAFTGNTTSGSPIVTSVSSTTNMFVGMQVNGGGITHPTAILTIDSAVADHADAERHGDGINCCSRWTRRARNPARS